LLLHLGLFHWTVSCVDSVSLKVSLVDLYGELDVPLFLLAPLRACKMNFFRLFAVSTLVPSLRSTPSMQNVYIPPASR
ncbi:hypothetical protein NEOLEDRAFT_484978, partial [Neolentinus lepideus HHB14362 ss-1]